MRRSYAGGAVSTTITSPITTSSPNAVLNSADGWPDSSGGPFAAVIDRGTVTEEKVLISDRSGTSITFAARGYDGTVAQNHSASATIEHIATAVDHDEANAHINASTGVHGVSGSVVGTGGSQILTGKTVSGPLGDFDSLRRAGFEVATRLGTETLQNKTLNSPIVTGTAQMAAVQADSVSVGGDQVVTRTASQVVENKTIKNSTIENSTLVSAGLDAGSTSDGAEIVNISKAQTLTSKTLTSPALTDPAMTGAATLDGVPVAVKNFAPQYDKLTTNSASATAGNTVVAYSKSVTVPAGAVEVFFSWNWVEHGATPAGCDISLVMDGVSHATVNLISSDSSPFLSSGGTLRGIYQNPSAGTKTLEVRLHRSAVSGATYIACNASGPGYLGVRPWGL